jgi:hypothetical protein
MYHFNFVWRTPVHMRVRAHDHHTHVFFVNTAQVELDFAPCIGAVLSSCMYDTDDNLVQQLHVIDRALVNMTLTMTRMDEHLRPNVFYYGFRRYLGGYTNSPFKEVGGLLYEGACLDASTSGEVHPHTGTNARHMFNGGSAAQSVTVQILDAFFNIQHALKSHTFLR